MQLFALIAVTMCAFAANSVLARAGIFTFNMEPLLFAGVRLASGAAMLALLVSMRGGWGRVDRARVITASTLLLYLIPFSIAYLTLPSGVGALILFGVVQVTMFGGSYLAGTQPSARQWAGMAVAMSGLGWLLWPTQSLTLDAVGVVFMVVSGFGWGVFSMRGRGSKDPLCDMALSFVICAPVALVLMLVGTGWSLGGMVCAMVSGAISSGLGYALWYRVLPQVAATTSAVAQLSVPVIAIVAGAVLLNETITLNVVVASFVVLGGIALSVFKTSLAAATHFTVTQTGFYKHAAVAGLIVVATCVPLDGRVDVSVRQKPRATQVAPCVKQIGFGIEQTAGRTSEPHLSGRFG